uniref:Ribosomal protein s5 n=1 Tax=Karenia mikimotoi TaxID=225107 RepID=A0A2R4QHE0_KARMI|nr:ribosomal protein s5 [Karenia mikimotoi]
MKRERQHESKKHWRWALLANDQVARVTKGGKQKSLRLTVAVGDQHGKIGVAVGSGNSFAIARRNAIRRARRNVVKFPLLTRSRSIKYEVEGNFGAAKILLRPRPRGTGIKAGKVSHIILRLAGIKNIMAKQLGSVSRINNARAVLFALSQTRSTKLKRTIKQRRARKARAARRRGYLKT